MPLALFVLILTFVLFAAGVTVWLLSVAGPGALMLAIPVALIATLAVRKRIK